MKKENRNTGRSGTFISCWFKKALFRSSCPEVFSKKSVLRNFTNFTGKHLDQSFFNKVAGLRFWYSCFPVNFAKFLRAPFFIEHLRWLLLFIDGAIPLCNFKFQKNILLTKDFFPQSFQSCKFFHKSVSFVKNGT